MSSTLDLEYPQSISLTQHNQLKFHSNVNVKIGLRWPYITHPSIISLLRGTDFVVVFSCKKIFLNSFSPFVDEAWPTMLHNPPWIKQTINFFNVFMTMIIKLTKVHDQVASMLQRSSFDLTFNMWQRFFLIFDPRTEPNSKSDWNHQQNCDRKP